MAARRTRGKIHRRDGAISRPRRPRLNSAGTVRGHPVNLSPAVPWFRSASVQPALRLGGPASLCGRLWPVRPARARPARALPRR